MIKFSCKKWWISLIAIIMILGSFTGCSSSQSSSTQPKKEEAKKEAKKEDSKINYDNFTKIQMGAKYEEVVALIGAGKEETSSEVNGIKTIMYTWKGSGISNLNMTIQNGVVMSKTQLGLKSMDAKVTLDKYNQIQNGSDYDSIKAILGGDGIIMSQTKFMDTEAIVYGWVNKDGSNISATFSNGKMTTKAQFSLK